MKVFLRKIKGEEVLTPVFNSAVWEPMEKARRQAGDSSS
jgi:hypothetical protein